MIPSWQIHNRISDVLNWHSHLDGCAKVQAIFSGLQKAFDTVPHAKLISPTIYP